MRARRLPEQDFHTRIAVVISLSVQAGDERVHSPLATSSFAAPLIKLLSNLRMIALSTSDLRQ